MTSLQLYVLIALVFCAIPGGFFWFQVKDLLRERGYPVSYFNQRRHMKDFFYMQELIHSERDPLLQAKYRRIRACMTFILVANLTLAALFTLAIILPLLEQA